MTRHLTSGTGDRAGSAASRRRSESPPAADRPATGDDTAARAWHAMRRLVFDLHDRRGQVSDALQMGYIRAKALVRLLAGPRTMRELAAELATDAPYTTVVVDDLERRQLVQRSTHPQDRRVKIVTITRGRPPSRGGGRADSGRTVGGAARARRR